MRQHTILHTIETGGPGGAETVLLQLATKLNPSRFRSVAFVPEGSWLPQQLEGNGVPIVVERSRGWYDFGLPLALFKMALQQRAALIHSHLPGQSFYACLVARLSGRKVVVTFHGARELVRYRGLSGTMKRWLVRDSASVVVVVSDYLRRLVIDSGFPSEKVVRIYNGVDVERFEGAERGRLRRELGLPASATLIGMVANLRQSKGYEYFVQAARQVAEAFPDARFVAVGEKEESMAANLAQMVHELGLDSRFAFLGFRADVPEVLADLDVFVLASVSEGLSIATLEAMAAGKPVVVTRSGGPEEIVEDGRTGLLAPVADPAALAARICELIRNPAQARTLADNARAEARNKYSVMKMIEEYQSLYERCLSSG